MQEDNIAIRLKFLIQELGINNSVFAENCGISRATLSQMLTGRNKKISDIIIGQIHKAYPSLSIMWLLFNEGDMWLGTPPSDSNPDPDPDEQEACAGIDDTNDFNIIGPTERENVSIKRNSSDETSQNGSENPDFRTTARPHLIKQKENGLNQDQNTPQRLMEENVNDLGKNFCNFNKIENYIPKTRKVVQITIYYDDSTFESFYPKNH